MKIAADYSLQTLYYNVHGVDLNPKIKLVENG
jgi:hypothetical protein